MSAVALSSISNADALFANGYDTDIPGTISIPPYMPPARNVPLVTIDGSGNCPVLTITGISNVGLHTLTVTGGQTSDDASGGGINVNGSSGLTNVYLMDHTPILFNTATVSGGGMRIEGNTRLYALKPFTLIGFSHAPNRYDIDMLTVNITTGATVRIFTTDSNNPVQLSGNFASHTGGAVYLLRPEEDFNGFGASVHRCCARVNSASTTMPRRKAQRFTVTRIARCTARSAASST